MKEIVHCWEHAQFVLSPSLLASRKLEPTPSWTDIHSFWFWPFFLLLELFALETHFTINFFSHPHQRAGTYIPLQVCPSLRKILVLSLSWCFLHCHGEDEQRTLLTWGRVLLILILTGTDALLMVFPTLSEGHPSVQTSLSSTLPQIKCLKPTWPQIQDISILLSEQAGPGTLDSLLWTLRLKRTFYGYAILETEGQSHKQAPHM